MMRALIDGGWRDILGVGLRRLLATGASLLLCGLWGAPVNAAQGILQLREGYFWDPVVQEWFIPHGIAYQTWNTDAGANQSYDQVWYDMVEFKKAYANSVRCEFVWPQMELEPDKIDWRRADELVRQARALGLRLFVLIGFQWPPGWFGPELRAVNSLGKPSNLICYENPDARRAYTNFMAKVTARYKDEPAIGAWILGNEYAYYDLWDPDRTYLGFDPISVKSFRNYLESAYGGDISALNARWQTNYASFADVQVFTNYPADRHNPGYHELLQWRKKSIGDFVAQGAVAARAADPNHLLTYSMVGGLFETVDSQLSCEDSRTIVERCRAAGAPLDFWSLNNYANATLTTETGTTDFALKKHQAYTGLPVLVTETGHSSTEDSYKDASDRQAGAMVGRLWETLLAGALGVHVFTWNDRDVFGGRFVREKGFGIVQGNRLPKTNDAYGKVREVFRRFESVGMQDLMHGSSPPKVDVNFFWSTNSDMGWPRANHEAMRLWHVFRRLGYQPGILGDSGFAAGGFATAPALLVSRGYQLAPEQLERLATDVVAAGVHIHANGDLPGQYDAWHLENPAWRGRMRELFGLSVENAHPDWEGGSLNSSNMFQYYPLRGVDELGPIHKGYHVEVLAWKTWLGVVPQEGRTILINESDKIPGGTRPALHVHSRGASRTAATLFPVGELNPSGDVLRSWEARANIVNAIYRGHFKLEPSIDLEGPNSSFVYRNYRVCRNGSVLVGLYNAYTNPVAFTLKATGLIRGLKVEDLTHGGIVVERSDGTLPSFVLPEDGYRLLYAYSSDGPTDASLVQSSPEKLWFEDAPATVWAGISPAVLEFGHVVPGPGVELVAALVSKHDGSRLWAVSAPLPVAGTGRSRVPVAVPAPDLKEPEFRSSVEGGDYEWRAWLERGGVRLSEVKLPVRFLWGVRPAVLPDVVQGGQTYRVPVTWQELPSFLPEYASAPLDRARLWDSLASTRQFCRVVLELRSGGLVVASNSLLTREGSGWADLDVSVPAGAGGPFAWVARVEAAPGVATHDMMDSFEGRRSGAFTAQLLEDTNSLSPLWPWKAFTYPEGGGQAWYDEGVQLSASDGAQSGFLVITNGGSSSSGVALQRVFEKPWALPMERAKWGDYRFSVTFQLPQGTEAVAQLQVGNTDPKGEGRWMEYSRAVKASDTGWHTLSATLDEFVKPSWSWARFDPGHLDQLVFNLRLLTKHTVYLIAIDDIRFDGPDVFNGPGPLLGIYNSEDDRSPKSWDSDGDGLADAVETGTGVYRGPNDTGSRPDRADTDGDGCGDGAEVIAGTSPVDVADVLRIGRVHPDGEGHLVVGWMGRAGRRYTIERQSGSPSSGSGFEPVAGLVDLQATADGWLEAEVDPASSEAVFYRLTVR